MLWVEDHNSPLNQSLIKSKALTLLNSRNAEACEETTEEKCETHRDWFMRYHERRCPYNMKEQDETVTAGSKLSRRPN